MASSGRQYRSLILKAGESAITRFLPVQMGPKKTWFARIARHWVGKRPVLCQRQTSPHFNGAPDHPCPLCDLEMEYSQSGNKATADLARKMGAFPKILTYLFVFEITDDRNRKLPTPTAELYAPNEYWIARDGWKEIDSLWRRSLEKNPPYGFLDPVSGYDFTISRDNRNGYRHMREDPQPIDKNKSVDQMLDIIDAAFRKVKMPDTTPLSADEMEATVEKALELLDGSKRGGASARGRSAVDRDADSEPPAASMRGRGEVTESSRSRSEAPARSATEPSGRREAPPPVQEPTRPQRAAPVADAEETHSTVNQELDAVPAEDRDPPPPVRSAGSPGATPRRSAPPPPARTTRIEADPEELARERRDPAPATESPDASSTAVVPEGRGGRSSSAAAQDRLSSRMRSSISRLGGAAL